MRQSRKTRRKPRVRTAQAKRRRRHWLTPKAWDKRCSHCGNRGAVAVRPADHRHACEGCIARLGINASESKAWHDGGSRAGASVRVKFVDPATEWGRGTDANLRS